MEQLRVRDGAAAAALQIEQEGLRLAERKAANAEKVQRVRERRCTARVAELQQLLKVEKANVTGLEERLQVAQVAAISTAAPLRAVEEQCVELQGKLAAAEGKLMSQGREAAKLRAHQAANQVAAEHGPTKRQLACELEAARAQAFSTEPHSAGLPLPDPVIPRVRQLQPGPKQPYDPFVAEMLRQIVSYGKVPKHNVPAVMALCHAAITREVPSLTSLSSKSHVDEAFSKLGALDAEDRANVNATDRHSFSVASDGGSDNNVKTVYKGQGRYGKRLRHWQERTQRCNNK